MARYFTAIALILCCFRLAAGQPYLQRGGTNLITNPDIYGSTGWVLGGSSVYDNAISGDSGTGSMKMSIPYPASNYSYIESSGLIAVMPGKTYTLSFNMRSDIFPPPGPTLYAGFYDSNHVFVRNSLGSDQSVTATDSWEECVFLFRPQPGEVYLKIKSTVMFQPLNYTPGSVWLDNIYLGEGIGFGQAPTTKTSFNGAQTKVDELGNVEVYQDGIWVPFFPIGIYADGRRTDWADYSNQGFNTQMWASSYPTIQRAKNATSSFNPNGMMSGLQIADYTNTGEYNYGNLSLLTTRISEIADNNLMDSLLWYYWDNENSYSEWDNPLSVTDKIKELDLDAGGNRLHPIYALQGNEGIARKYNSSNVHMTDVVGGYVTQATSATHPDESRGALQLVTLDNIEQQRNPVVLAQINHGVGMLFRPRIFTAIAKGAKGIGFWKDDVDGGTLGSDAIPVQDQPWWDDLPNIRREIDQLLPIIRMPHWTNWSLSSDNSLTDYGTRDYQGTGYVIVTNEKDSAQSVTFTIFNLPYAASAAKNFFTDEIEADVNNNQFTVTIPAYGSKVYLLQNKACTPTSYALGLTVAGNGSGSVLSTPSGISCGSNCVGSYTACTPVTLTATAANDSTFVGWSGSGCSGTQSCSINLTSDTDLFAIFAKTPPGISQPLNQWTAMGLEEVSAYAIDPANPTVFYAGLSYNKLMKSGDSGQTWSEIAINPPWPANASPMALLVDPTTTPTTVYVGNFSGVYKSTDGGMTWRAFNDGLSSYSYKDVTKLARDPRANCIYAGSRSHGLFRLNKGVDGSGTWQHLMSWNFNNFAVDPTNANNLYLGWEGVFKSSDGGATWSGILNGWPSWDCEDCGLLDAYELAIDPFDPSIVYATAGYTHLYKWNNNAQSWAKVALNSGPETATSIGIPLFDPAKPGTMYVATDLGVCKSSDSGSTWQILGGTEIVPWSARLTLDPINPQILYATMGVNGGVLRFIQSQ